MSWGAFGVLLAFRGAHSDSGPNFFGRFPTFGALRGPKGRQKEPQGPQRRPTWCPEWCPRAPKAFPKAYFLEISETLIFDDSTMIFMVFSCILLSARGLGSSKALQRSNHGPLAGAGRPGQQDSTAAAPSGLRPVAGQGPGSGQDPPGSRNFLRRQLQF